MDDSRIANPCYAVTDPSVDLRMTTNETSIKLYMADTCPLVNHSSPKGIPPNEIYRDVPLETISLNEKMLVENVVAQSLHARGEDLLFYSSHDRADPSRCMEIDFLLIRPFDDAAGKLRVSPVEVKSGAHYFTKSLEKRRAVFGSRVGTEFVLHPKQLEVEGNHIKLPLYMAHLL